MTDAEWLGCDDPNTLLEALRPHADRPLRLLAAACCRHLRRGLDHPAAASAIDEAIRAVERHADGVETKAALKRARRAVRAVRHTLPAGAGGASPAWCALWVAEVAASENACGSVVPEFERLAGLGLLGTGGRPPVCDWLRCLLVPPSRDRAFDPAWRTPGVIGLARSIAEGGPSVPMGRLGEALRAAGCDDPCLLGHCGSPSGHLRGCWVLDVLLGVR